MRAVGKRVGAMFVAAAIGASPVAAETCLMVPVMTEAGEQVMSPFGVDRSSSPGASAGYHQGLDITNNAGRGDPILAGVYGRVFVSKSGSGGNVVGVETDDGKQRFLFFHLDGRNVRVGDEVEPDTVVGIQGSTGVSYTAVHLHLSALLRGSELRDMGNSGGRVWRSASGWAGTKSSSPLTASQISGAVPDDFYFVNPETFLHHRIPFNVPPRYEAQGIIRPDNMTLAPTCEPSDEYFDRSAIRSANGGTSLSDGMQTDAAYQSAEDGITNATHEFKEAAIVLGQAQMGGLAAQNIGGSSPAYRALGWAGLAALGGD